MQDAPPADIYLKPANKFVAGFMGTTSFLEGTVVFVEGEKVMLETDDGLRLRGHGRGLASGDRASAAVRPETLEIVGSSAGGENLFTAKVERSYFTGEIVDYQLRVGNTFVRAKCDTRRLFGQGESLSVRIDADRLPIVPEEKSAV